jgi:hypothetical protein
LKTLHTENAALDARLGALEQQVLAYDQDPAYLAARRALSFEDSIRRSIKVSGLQARVQLFGTSKNPLITTGDEGIQNLSERNRRAWSETMAEDYAAEATEITKKIGELKTLLASMQALANEHAKRTAPRRGLVEGVTSK